MKLFSHKLAYLFVALGALTLNAGAQEHAYAEAPNLKLTLTLEKTVWRKNEAASVKIRLENASGNRVEIPSTLSFMADNRKSDEGMVTTREGVFWSPVSLLKIYDDRASICNNDLSPDRVEVVKKKVLVIRPSKDTLVLEKDETKEFDFDLAQTCWSHSILSNYPSETIFKVAADYKPKAYRVYFQMYFRLRTNDPNDPRFFQLKSNAVEVTIN